MAVAEASLSTVKVAMSLGLTIARPLDMPGPASLATGTPSMTISGLLLAESEAPPRMRISAPAPGAPLPEVMFTPGTLPRSSSWGEVRAPRLISSAFTAMTEPVMSFFFTAP